MFRQSLKLWIGRGVSEDLGVPCRYDAATLSLKRLRDDRGSAAPSARARNLINKLHQLNGEPNGNLPCHPIMVPNWYRPLRAA